jgi:hypothetical protein
MIDFQIERRRMKLVLLTVLFAVTLGVAQKVPNFLYITTPILKPGEVISGTLGEDDGQNLKDGSRLEVLQGRFKEGEAVEFTLTSDFDGYLTLYAPDKTVLASNDDVALEDTNTTAAYQSSIITEIPETGRYVLIVSGYSEYDLGSYEVMARSLEVTEDGPITLPTDLNGIIAVSDDFAEFVDPTAEESDVEDGSGSLGEFNYDAFTLELNEATAVRFDATSPTLDTVIAVLDEAGNTIAMNDDQNIEDDLDTPDIDESLDYTVNAGVEVTLEAGRYEVRVAAYDFGFYSLSAFAVE